MKNEKTLEEIFWKEGKFVNSKNEEVKPEPIGRPRMYSCIRAISIKLNKCHELGLYEDYQGFIEKNKINAYMQGKESNRQIGRGTLRYLFPIQFYKI